MSFPILKVAFAVIVGASAAGFMLASACAACQSSGMILNQPSLSSAAWEGEVNKMSNVYKAPVSTADIPTIIVYSAAPRGA